jgi:Icc-related predicted phosphoesterase
MNKTFCFISDTHCKHKQVDIDLTGVDFLICTGDFTSVGKEHEVHNFNKWIGSLGMDKEHIIVVCGNHDFWFERNTRNRIDQVCTNFTYLQEEAYECEGVKFYGAPHQPEFYNWAFNVPRGEPLRKIWAKIPDDTDVLLTHGPPWSILDRNREGTCCGCEELQLRVEELDLKIHAFGHIHESHGVIEKDGTIYVNGSILDRNYNVAFKPTVFDIDI